MKIDLAPSIQYFSQQQPGGCGIACLQMILSFYGHSPIPEAGEWLRQAFELGVINEKVGMRYDEIHRLISPFGLSIKIHRHLSSSTLATILLEGRPVMVSIKGPEGGHLVVACGVQMERGAIAEFSFLDPASAGLKTFPLAEWEKVFNGRGVELKSL